MWRPFEQFIRSIARKQHQRELWRAARSLSRRTLRGEEEGDDWALLPAEPGRHEPRFLGYYSVDGLAAALEAYGFHAAARRRGYHDLRIDVREDDRTTSTMRGFGRVAGDPVDYLLFETRCSMVGLPRPRWFPKEVRDCCAGMRAVRIEWMLLQDPRASFSPERPPLPGQRHPGLGLGREVMEVLRILGWRQQLAAYVINPFYVHNAIVYSRKFVCVEPEDQGWFFRLVQASDGRSLQDVGLAVANGYLKDGRTGEPVEWPSPRQMSPLTRPLIRLYRSRLYADAVERAFERTRLRFDWAAYDEARGRLMEALPDTELADGALPRDGA